MAHPASGKKATEHINFGKAVDGIPNGTYAHRILHEITRRRQALEDVLKYPDTSTSTVMNTLHEYLVMPIRNVLSEARRPFKLRFKWSSFTNPEEEPSSNKDSDVDQVAFLVAVALWLMEHAHMVFPLYPQTDNLNEDKMKDALNSLKLAAGLCECVEQRPKSDFLDLTVPVNQALGTQCLAEAQMLTINRAVNKGNKPSLISQLAHEVAKRCISASTILQKCGKTVEKWRLFLMFKGELYFGVARCFQAISFLEENEQSGMSVAVLGIASKHIGACVHLAKEYSKFKPKAKHPLTDCRDFVWAQKLIQLKIEKSNRENSMIYHQRIPEEAAPLDEAKCLVSSTAFTFPPPDLSGSGITEEMGMEADETFCDGKSETDEKLLEGKDDKSDEDNDDETRSGCACQRWLFISIFMPLIIVLSLLGCIAWLILWPINKLCPVGQTFTKVFNTTENFMKLPVISIRWAIGERPTRKIKPNRRNLAERKSYGGTNEVNMSKLDKTRR